MPEKKKSSFLSQILIYGFGIALNYGIGFILLPIYSRLMPEVQYGVLEILNRTVEVVSLIFLTQYAIAFIRFYREKDDEAWHKIVVSTCIVFVFAVAGLLAGLLFLFRTPLAEILFKSTEYSHYFSLIALRYFLGMLFIVPFMYFQASEQPTKYIIISGTQFALTTLFTIYLLYNMDDKVDAVLYGRIVIMALYIATVGVYVFWNSARKIDLSLTKELIKFSWSFTFVGIYSFIIINGDRYFLLEYWGKAQVGLYSFGYKIGMVLNTFVYSPIIRAWNAKMVEVMRSDKGEHFLARLSSYGLLLYSLLGLTLAIFSRELVFELMGADYHQSYKFIPPIVLAYAFTGTSIFFDTGIYISKKTYLKIWHWISAVISLLLYYLLIPSYGMMGAALATIGSNFTLFFVTWRLSMRAMPMKYEFVKMAKILVPAVVIYLFVRQLEIIETTNYYYIKEAMDISLKWLYLLIVGFFKAMMIVIYAFVLWILKVFEPDDYERIKRFINILKSKLPGKRGDANNQLDTI